MNGKKILSQIGFDTHESDLYLALIQLGEGTAGQLAKKSGVPRTYTYKILEELIDKGMVSSSEGNKVRKYSITDYDAPGRYLERKQLELYRAQQEAQQLSSQLETLANPEVPAAAVEQLNNHSDYEEFWHLLHSTITREIWVINPPEWWGDEEHSREVRKWEKYRAKQHIWEKRLINGESTGEIKYTEISSLKNPIKNNASLFLIDHYHVQVSSWEPFRALRIDSQEIVDLIKSATMSNF